MSTKEAIKTARLMLLYRNLTNVKHGAPKMSKLCDEFLDARSAVETARSAYQALEKQASQALLPASANNSEEQIDPKEKEFKDF